MRIRGRRRTYSETSRIDGRVYYLLEPMGSLFRRRHLAFDPLHGPGGDFFLVQTWPRGSLRRLKDDSFPRVVESNPGWTNIDAGLTRAELAALHSRPRPRTDFFRPVKLTPPYPGHSANGSTRLRLVASASLHKIVSRIVTLGCKIFPNSPPDFGYSRSSCNEQPARIIRKLRRPWTVRSPRSFNGSQNDQTSRPEIPRSMDSQALSWGHPT